MTRPARPGGQMRRRRPIRRNARLAFLVTLLVGIGAAVATVTTLPPAAAASQCTTTARSTYTVTLCIEVPLNGAIVSGDVTSTATVSISGTSPGVRRVVFYLDGTYVLTDFAAPFTFSLPSSNWVDGTYTLQVEALLRDNYKTPRTGVTVTFANGVTSPPTNTAHFTPSQGQGVVPGAPIIVAAAGDGASGEVNADRVVDLVGSWDPNLFLYLGDVYEKGTPTEFANWYGEDGQRWGTFRSFTNPTIGNHEYEGGQAPGYFGYWDNVPSYYSYDIGSWHFISLNSNDTYEDIEPGSAQYAWLDHDLRQNASSCTIVYHHHPLFNVGPEGSKTELAGVWKLLYQHGVEIVLAGHDHDYQRWTPLNDKGSPSASGVIEFVVGGGGHGKQAAVTTDTRLVTSFHDYPDAFGALRLELNETGATFSYQNLHGAVLDAGTIPCHGSPEDVTPPSTPANLSASIVSSGQVDLSWAPSTDNSGVHGYRVIRDGQVLTETNGATTSYSDTSVQPGEQYTYWVTAVDFAGNESSPSDTVAVEMPPLPPLLGFGAQADTYVNAASPGTAYGSATVLRADASPDVRSYIRFTVFGTGGAPPVGASLRLYATSSSSAGYEVHSMVDTGWSESATTYNAAPACGPVIGTSGRVSAGTWVDVPLGDTITGEGAFSFCLTTPSSTAVSAASRETGSTAPQLVVDFGPGFDSTPPEPPGSLTATVVSTGQVDLSWGAATDDVGVDHYTVYRDAVPIGTSPSPSVAFSDLTTAPDSTYTYTVTATDAAGNESLPSNAADVTIPALPATVTVAPEADTYVSSASPTTSYGSSKSLRADASPDVHSLVRFTVSGSGTSTPTGVALHVTPTSSSASGYEVRSLADSSWPESTTTYGNAPSCGAVLATSGPVMSGVPVEIPLTDAITGDGTYSFCITTPSSTAVSLASREAGDTGPRLVLMFT